MRDPKRIAPFLDTLRSVWEQNPDWRFGQLVVNILGEDPFYVKDEVAQEAMKKFRKEK